MRGEGSIGDGAKVVVGAHVLLQSLTAADWSVTVCEVVVGGQAPGHAPRRDSDDERT